MSKHPCVALFLVFILSANLAYASNDRDAAINAEFNALVDAQLFSPSAADTSTSDGKAEVYQLEGKAVLTAKGSPVERDLKVGDEIGIGDSVFTEKGASLSISFDRRKLNAVRIPANTKATFTSIEPTDIKLEDGTIFSVVNGLAKGSTWKVTTPSAVAAVRGTVFETTYHADTGEFFAATLEVPDDGKISAIEVESLGGEGRAEITEGKEISFKEGEAPTQEMVQDLVADKAAEVQKFHQEVTMERQKSDDQSKVPGGPNGPGGGNGPNGSDGRNTSAGKETVSPSSVNPMSVNSAVGLTSMPAGMSGMNAPGSTGGSFTPPTDSMLAPLSSNVNPMDRSEAFKEVIDRPDILNKPDFFDPSRPIDRPPYIDPANMPGSMAGGCPSGDPNCGKPVINCSQTTAGC